MTNRCNPDDGFDRLCEILLAAPVSPTAVHMNPADVCRMFQIHGSHLPGLHDPTIIGVPVEILDHVPVGEVRICHEDGGGPCQVLYLCVQVLDQEPS